MSKLKQNLDIERLIAKENDVGIMGNPAIRGLTRGVMNHLVDYDRSGDDSSLWGYTQKKLQGLRDEAKAGYDKFMEGKSRNIPGLIGMALTQLPGMGKTMKQIPSMILNKRIPFTAGDRISGGLGYEPDKDIGPTYKFDINYRF